MTKISIGHAHLWYAWYATLRVDQKGTMAFVAHFWSFTQSLGQHVGDVGRDHVLRVVLKGIRGVDSVTTFWQFCAASQLKD